MHARYEKYHRTADHCLQMALNARDDQFRESWLQLAQSWLRMIPPVHLETPLQSFERAVRLKSTGQKRLGLLTLNGR